MRWIDLAFLHWPVSIEALRPLVPDALELDVYDGSAWVAVTPFRMTRVRPAFAPSIPTATGFPELNVRTYVRHRGWSGVWFFSLDAASWLAVIGARTAIGLPYYHARMSQRRVQEQVHYASARDHMDAPSAAFHGRYAPIGDVYLAEHGSLEYWLTERYSLFSLRAGRLFRLDIEHARWPLQHATVAIEVNTMTRTAGIDLPADPPHVRFVRQLDVTAHWPVLA